VWLVAAVLPDTFAENINDPLHNIEDDSGETPVAHLEDRLVYLENVRRILNTQINELDAGSPTFERALDNLAAIDSEMAEIHAEMNQIWNIYNGDSGEENRSRDSEDSESDIADNEYDDLDDVEYTPYEPFDPIFEAPPARMSAAEIAAFAAVPLNDDVVLIDTNARLAQFLSRPAGNAEFGPDADGRHFRITANLTAPTARISGRPGVFTGILDGENPSGGNFTITGLRLGATAGATGIGLVQQAGDGAIIRNLNFFNDATADGTRAVDISANTALHIGLAIGSTVGQSGDAITIDNVHITSARTQMQQRINATVSGSWGGLVGQVGANSTLNMIDIFVANIEFFVQGAGAVGSNNGRVAAAGGLVGSVDGGTLNITTYRRAINNVNTDMRGNSRGAAGATPAPVAMNTGVIRGGGVLGFVFSGHVDISDTTVTSARNSLDDPIRGLGSMGGIAGGLSTRGTLRLTNVENQAWIQVNRAGGDGNPANGLIGRAGGLVGHNAGTLHIYNSRNFGVIQQQHNNATLGGLVGYTGTSSITVIRNSQNGVEGNGLRPGQTLPAGTTPGQLLHRNSTGTTDHTNNASRSMMGGIIGRSRGRLTIENTSNYGHINKVALNNNATNRRTTATGGIVGRAAPVGGQVFTLTNVTNHGVINAGTDSRVGRTGGIVGELMSAPRGTGIVNLTNVENRATITGGNEIGGIIGHIRPAGVSIRDARNFGNINAGGSRRPNSTGGIVGRAGGSRLTINTAYNRGNINTTTPGPHSAAGIVGRGAGRWLTINDAHNHGNVRGHHNAAGIVGMASARNITIDYATNHGAVNTERATSRSIAGGIVAHSNGRDLLIRNTGNFGRIAIASGATTSSNMDGAGGIVGRSRQANARVEVSFNQGTIVGRVTAGGIVGRNQGTLQITDVYNIGAVGGNNENTTGNNARVGNGNGILGRRRTGAVRITRAYVSARVNGFAVATSQTNARTIRMTGRTPAATTGITFSGVFVDGTAFQSLFAGAANAPITQQNRNGINVVDTELLTSGFLPGFSSGPWRIGIAGVDGEYLRTYPYFNWQIPGGADLQEPFFSYIRSYQEGRDRIPPEELGLDLLLVDEEETPNEVEVETDNLVVPDEYSTELIDAEALIELLESEELIESLESDEFLEVAELLELLEEAELIEILETEEAADLIEVVELVELLEAVGLIELLGTEDFDDTEPGPLEVAELLELLEEADLIVLIVKIDEREESNETSNLNGSSEDVTDLSDEEGNELDDSELYNEAELEGYEEIDPMSDWIVRYRWRPVMDMNLPSNMPHEIRFNFDCDALYDYFSVSIPCTFNGAQNNTRIFNTYFNNPNAGNNVAGGSLNAFQFPLVPAGTMAHEININRTGMTSIGLISNNGVVGFETREVIGRIIIRGYDEFEDVNNNIREYIDHTSFLIISDDWPSVSLNEAFMNCLDESWPCPPELQVDGMRGMGLIQVDTAEDDPSEIVNDSLHPKPGEYEPANQRSNEQTVLDDLSDYTIVRITALGYAPAYRIIRTGDLNELSSGVISVPMERIPFQIRTWVPQESDDVANDTDDHGEHEIPPQGPPGANTSSANNPTGTREGFGILPWTDWADVNPNQPANMRNLSPGSNLAIRPRLDIENNSNRGDLNASLSFDNTDTVEVGGAGVRGHFDVQTVMWGDTLEATAWMHSTNRHGRLRFDDLIDRHLFGGVNVGHIPTTAIGRGGVNETVYEPILDLDLYVENLALPRMYFRFVEITGVNEETGEWILTPIPVGATALAGLDLIIDNNPYPVEDVVINERRATAPLTVHQPREAYAGTEGVNSNWHNQDVELMVGSFQHFRVEGIHQNTMFDVIDNTGTFVPLMNQAVSDYFEWFFPLYEEFIVSGSGDDAVTSERRMTFSSTANTATGRTNREDQLDNSFEGDPILVRTLIIPLIRIRDVEVRVVERIAPGEYVEIPHSTLHQNDVPVPQIRPGVFTVRDEGFNALYAQAPNVPGFYSREVNIGTGDDIAEQLVIGPDGVPHIRIVLNPIFFDVDFDLMGGEDEADFPTQSVRHGSTATNPYPTVPTRENYEFDGWFTAETGGVLFDFSTPILTGTTICEIGVTIEEGDEPCETGNTLFARWTRLHTVNFDLQDGEDQVDFPDQLVRDGDTAVEPSEEPTKDGYRFAGWYTEEEDGEPFDFEVPIYEDTTVYARWIPITEFEFVKVNHLYDDRENANFARLPNAMFNLYIWEYIEAECELDNEDEDDCEDEGEYEWILLHEGIVSNANGLVQFPQPLDAGRAYKLVETEAPEGFRLPEGHWYINIDEDRTITITRSEDENEDPFTDVPFDFGYVPCQEGLEECESGDAWFVGNMPIGNEFRFTKTNDYLYMDLDANYPTHINLERLRDARFNLYRVEDDELELIEEDVESDINGLVEFETLLTLEGTYRLVETRAPSGFRLPHGYWIITWDEETERFNMQAGGTVSLVPAFRAITCTVDSEFPECEDGEAGDIVYLVGNFPITDLPSTGGLGAMTLTLIGGLGLAFVVLLYLRGKASDELAKLEEVA